MRRTFNREKEEQLIANLAAGKTMRETAAAVGITERTVQRRMANEKFRTRIMEIRSSAVSSATARLLMGMKEAANVLMMHLEDSDKRIQQRAAVKLIELGVKLNTINELEKRIEQLERYVGFHLAGS
jgi:HEAT repeat protein